MYHDVYSLRPTWIQLDGTACQLIGFGFVALIICGQKTHYTIMLKRRPYDHLIWILPLKLFRWEAKQQLHANYTSSYQQINHLFVFKHKSIHKSIDASVTFIFICLRLIHLRYSRQSCTDLRTCPHSQQPSLTSDLPAEQQPRPPAQQPRSQC